MAVTSGKQYRFMQMMAHNPEKAYKNKGVGPSEAVAREFINKTPAKKRKLFMKQKKSNPGKYY